jgi:integrase
MALKGTITTSDCIDFDICRKVGLKLVKEEKTRNFGLYILTSIYTGLRMSDVLDIKWSILDGNNYTTRERKTGKAKSITLNSVLVEILTQYKKDDDFGFIFKSQKGTVYTKQSINRLMKTHFKNEVNVSNISSHSLRKSFGNRVYVSNGKTDAILHLLSEMFNHSSVSITRKYLGIKQEQYDNIYLSL